MGCDALQVYRGFDAATAKPGREARERVPHHLVDHVDPRRDYTLADFVRDAEGAIASITARGGVPIVAGGTGMYLRGLLRGIVAAPARDPELRERIRRAASRFGAARLHRRLASLDPESARRIPPRDAQRVQRAIEIALTGRDTWSGTLLREGTWSGAKERFDAAKFVLELPAEALARKLDMRVDAFFEAGLVEEVRGLLRSGVPDSANAFKAIGYREVLRALRAGEDPEATRDEVRRATRRLAKRQRTWFRSEPGVVRVDASRGPEAVAAVVEEAWLAGRG